MTDNSLFGDIYLSSSPDMVHWGGHRFVMGIKGAFPCATLFDEPTGRIATCYGGADTVTGLAFANVDEVIDFVKSTSEL